MYFFSVRKAGSLYGEATPEREEAPQSHDDRLAGVLRLVHLLKKNAMNWRESLTPKLSGG